MTVLYLARHGETVDNANQILQGQTQGMLNEKGQEQAENLAKSLDGIHIDAVIASDLKRAVDTAEVIAKRRSLPLITPRYCASVTGGPSRDASYPTSRMYNGPMMWRAWML